MKALAVILSSSTMHHPTLATPTLCYRLFRDTTWKIQPYHSTVMTLQSATIPKAYIVPARCSKVIELLQRHHIATRRMAKSTAVNVSMYAIDSVSTAVVEEDSIPSLHVHPQIIRLMCSPDDIYVPTDQLHSLFLVALLEPRSIWGLSKYPHVAMPSGERRWPIARVEN
jgi:hypothetical protein